MKTVAIILGVLLAVGAAVALRLPDETRLSPDEALRRNPASPHRWADLGDALLRAGNRDQARQAYDRALQLAPGVPQIWVRAANFQFQLGDPPSGLRAAAHVLRIVDAYDDILFTYFDRLIPDPAVVLAAIGADRRAVRAYTAHLIASGNIEAAQIAWNRVPVKDERLKASYIDVLLNARRYQEAHALGCASICNGSFESEPNGSALDWQIQPSEQFETARDNTIAHSGHWSLRIRFRGLDNVSYANVTQTVIVRPGPHHLRAWVRTENITTNEGPRLEVLNSRTDSITGTNDWMPLDLSFVVPPEANVIKVRVIRTPSLKFDNKIDGAFWLDSVTLE